MPKTNVQDKINQDLKAMRLARQDQYWMVKANVPLDPDRYAKRKAEIEAAQALPLRFEDSLAGFEFVRYNRQASEHGELGLLALRLQDGKNIKLVYNGFPVTLTLGDAPALFRRAFQLARNAQDTFNHYERVGLDRSY